MNDCRTIRVLLDIWMLICCELCDRTSKIPIHERIHVQALQHERLLTFENNDPAMVRHLAMDAALAGKAAYRLDWSGTWELETDMPFYELKSEDAPPLEVVIRFELPAPIRVEKLLMAGFSLSRSAVRGMVDSGRIRLPMAIDAKAREDFTIFAVTTPPPREVTPLGFPTAVAVTGFRPTPKFAPPEQPNHLSVR
jgi:hypothetical protein